MTDWPDDYGEISVGNGTYPVTLETLENIKAAIAARQEWLSFQTMHGLDAMVRTVRIDDICVTTREGRRLHAECRQYHEKQLKADVPEWEEAG